MRVYNFVFFIYLTGGKFCFMLFMFALFLAFSMSSADLIYNSLESFGA